MPSFNEIWPQEVNPGKIIAVDDVTTERYSKDGGKVQLFDPGKAADAVIDGFYLKTLRDDKSIWAYREGIYEPNGEEKIDQILDRLAGNLYTIQQSKEVLKKVRSRSLYRYNPFDGNSQFFGVTNGVIDLETGKLMPFSSDHCITLKSPVKYDPKAKCPNFINFLWRSLNSIDDILTVIDMFVAMATTATWEYFVAMIGPGSNGKSVLEQVITAFFGPDQVTEVELSELNASQFIRGAIRRKRALINSEVQGTKMESRWIKMISGGTMIDSDQKNRDRIHFRPFCLQIFDTNSPPQFYDNSYGFQRRLIKLDFRYTFTDDPDPTNPWERKRDPSLLQSLTSEAELSGILNLIIARAPDILATRTIHRRTIGAELVAEYDRQSHSMSAFFNDCYDVQSEDSWKFFTPFEDVREKYYQYCRAINAAPENDRKLAFFIKESLGCKPDRDYVGEKQVRGYYGLILEKNNFQQIVDASLLDKTDISLIRQIKTDNKTDNTITEDTKTDKSAKYPVQILKQIYSYINNDPKKSVLSVLVSQDSEKSVLDPSCDLSQFAPDGRDLAEEGQWEDCEYCNLPLPPSWQNVRNGFIFCPDCLKIHETRNQK